jgi:hypothetical protein
MSLSVRSIFLIAPHYWKRGTPDKVVPKGFLKKAKVLALKIRKLKWADVWNTPKIRRVYSRLRLFDECLHTKSKRADIWSTTPLIRDRIEWNHTFETPQNEWERLDHLAFAVKTLIKHDDIFPLFRGPALTDRKTESAVTLLKRIYLSCEGRIMQNVDPYTENDDDPIFYRNSVTLPEDAQDNPDGFEWPDEFIEDPNLSNFELKRQHQLKVLQCLADALKNEKGRRPNSRPGIDFFTLDSLDESSAHMATRSIEFYPEDLRMIQDLRRAGQHKEAWQMEEQLKNIIRSKSEQEMEDDVYERRYFDNQALLSAELNDPRFNIDIYPEVCDGLKRDRWCPRIQRLTESLSRELTGIDNKVKELTALQYEIG